MKNFSEEFLGRVQGGTCGMIAWLPIMEDPKAKFHADCHLANWLTYLDQTGHYQTAKSWRHRVITMHPTGLTLPDRDPWAYDAKYIPPHGDRNPWRSHPSELWIERTPGRHRDEMTIAERKELADKVRREVGLAAKHMEMFPNEPKGKHQPEPPPKPKTLEELRQEGVDNPVKFSPALAAHLAVEK